MCNKSESISKIAAALVAFSGDIKAIEKDGNNPHFRSTYATLDNMIDETKPLLKKHGLTVMQFPGGDGEKVTVRTMILHESGEFIESEPLTLKAVKMDPQGAGSAITYARRYSYAAALSLSLGDDDDGNAASQPTTRPAQTQQSRPAQTHTHQQQSDHAAIQQSSDANRSQPSVNMISDAQVGLIKKLLKEKNVPDQAYRNMIAPKTSTKDLTKSEASEVIKKINGYVAEPEPVLNISDDDLPF